MPKARYAMTVGHCKINWRSRGGIRPPAGPGQSPGGGQGGSPGSSEDPEAYITKTRPETDSHGAFLTQDMPVIALLSLEFWYCWFILEVDEGSAVPVGWAWLRHITHNRNRMN